MKKVPAVFAIVLLGTAACWAGVAYTAVSRMQSQGVRRGAAGDEVIRVHGWAAGSNAKVEFVEGKNPMLTPGTYLVSTDGGKTMYLVDPAKKSYFKWDMAEALGGAGAMMQNMRGMGMKYEVSPPKVEKLLDESGGLMLGVATRHYRYRTTYSVSANMMGRVISSTTTVNEEEIWAAPSLLDPAMGIWLRRQGLKTGDEQMDRIIHAEMEKVQGLPIKRISVITTRDMQGRSDITRNETEITELKTVPVPDSTFKIPAGYKETEMTMPNMPDLKELQREMQKHQHDSEDDEP